MSRYLVSTAVIVALFATGVAGFSYVEAQSSSQLLEERRAELERELAEYEKEIAELKVFKEAKEQERQSLERDVAIIDAEIRQAELSIRARDLEIARLSRDISGKEETIDSLDAKLERERQSLAALLRRTNEIDDYSLVEMVLANGNISDFFQDLDRFTTIKSALDHSFDDIIATRVNTQDQKAVLLDRRSAEEELRYIQELEKRKIEEKRAERAEILRATKGQESAYQELIRSRQKSAAEIRAELFSLRGSAAIPFGEALAYAEEASRVTGVRPAFILGVIAQESNLGENVGSCHYKGNAHPTRDEPVFLDVVGRLGLDPDVMKVSCAPSYGYGGAMGPAQFIPSTWVLYEKRIGQLAGQVPPNPWDPRTAFIASGLLLADNGADGNTRAAERLAALRYFAGWKNATNPAYAFYGNGVMELAAKYQGLIDALQGS